MEQAFRDVHGFGINEYCNDTDKILQVEKRRDADYRQGQEVATRLERQVHGHS